MDSQLPAAEWRIRAHIGFTFVEVVVALAIIAVLAAVMIPGLTTRISSAQASNLIQAIRTINNGTQQFRENVGRYPSSIMQLSVLAAGSADLCGIVIPTANANQWRGPYMALTPLSTGIPSGDATILLALTRTPTTTSSSTVMDGTMSFDVTSVDSVTASDVEISFDGVSLLFTKYSTGSVIWAKTGGAGTGATGTLTYRVPVRGC